MKMELLNRKARRKIEKAKGIKAPVMERIDKGECYYCGQPVFVAPGQLYSLRNGLPIHKSCKSLST